MTINNLCHNLIFCLFEEIVSRKTDNLPTTLSCICYAYFQMCYNIGTITNNTLLFSGDRVQIPNWIHTVRSQISSSKNKKDILQNMLFYGHIGFLKELYSDFEITSLKLTSFGIPDLKFNPAFIQQLITWGGQHYSGKQDEITKSKYSSSNSWGMPVDTSMHSGDTSGGSDKWQNLVVPTGNYATDDGLPSIDINADTTYHIQNFLGKEWGTVRGFAISLPSENVPPELDDNNLDSESINKVLELFAIANFDERKKLIAELFSGSGKNSICTPGFWILISLMLSQKYNQSLEYDLIMFFVVSCGLLDAGIASWKNKALHEQPNPINKIRKLFNGIKINSWTPLKKDIYGSEWLPYQDYTVVSPPHPAGISDHITFSISAVRLLEWWFDNSQLYDPFKLVHVPNPQLISMMLNNQYKLFSCGEFCLDSGSSKIEMKTRTPKENVILKYTSLNDLCSDVCMARIYAGVEWIENKEDSQKVAEWVYDKVRTKFETGFKIKSPYKNNS
jgi:hypothetical protein